MNVVYYKICYESGMLWTWSFLNRREKNVVCYERGMLSMVGLKGGKRGTYPPLHFRSPLEVFRA